MSWIFRGLGFLVLAWVFGFVWFVASLPKAAPAEVETDAIVVLTGGPGRLARGVEILEAGRAKRMLISGVDPSVRSVELAKALGRDEKLFACCIDLGREAVDTRSNGDEVADWVRRHNYRSIRLVTSNYHVRRARLEIAARLDRELEIVEDPVAVPFGPALAAREWSKYAARRLWILTGRR